jgi:small-conductance mechanosensitive channel/CRP-like cAMP-binding protein
VFNLKPKKTWIFDYILAPLFLISLLLFLGRELYYENDNYIATLLWIGMTIIVIKLINLVLFQGICRNLAGKKLPRVLLDMVAGIIWIISGAFYLKILFNVDISALLATTSVSVAVLGIALRNLVLDFFSGIMISIESPYQVGDWIAVENKNIAGKVIEMNWRATRIMTGDNTILFVPNSKLASASFRNFSKPTPYFRDFFSVILAYRIPPIQAERLLLSAAYQVREIAEAPKKPDVKILEFGEEGVKWAVRFWVENYELKDKFKYEIQRNYLTNLRFSCLLRTTYPGESMKHTDHWSRNAQEALFLLKLVELFETLSDIELERLSESAIRKSYAKGKTIVQQGDSGDSFYILAEGVLTIHEKENGDPDREIARIGPGSCFGEMSLLTGEPRSKTVKAEIESIVYIITREHFRPLMESNERLVNNLGKMLAQRQLANSQITSSTHCGQAKGETLQRVIMNKILDFFGAKPSDPENA